VILRLLQIPVLCRGVRSGIPEKTNPTKDVA
jgi:hypothetical protein